MAGRIISGERQVEIPAVLLNAARAARGLKGLGVGPGDSVAMYMRNDFPFFEAGAAAGLLGAYAVPINWHLSAEETNYILNDCGAKALVIHADMLPKVRSGIPENVAVFVVPTPPEIAEAYNIPAAACAVPQGDSAWSDWLAELDPLVPDNLPAPGAMIYTSGTTGRPKGVRRLPKSMAEIEGQLRVINHAFGIQPGIRTIIPAPMYHSAPNAYSGLAVRLEAEEIVLMPRFEPEELLRLIEKHKITHIQTVPLMFVRLLKLPKDVREKYDVSSLQFVVHAAAPCSPEVKEQMIAWWGPVINEYYGSTETGSVVFCTSDEWLKHRGTVGKAMPGVELRILDEDGNDVPTGTPGDVYCRNTTGSDFTYNNDDEKRKKSERAGLIGVGDIGYLDEDGFLFLCDRKNDMVISGGVNIYPAEIENCLINHPGVADCAVFGIPDEEYGESLCAYIQPKAGQSLEVSDIRGFVRQHLAAYKVPKVVEFSPELPREDSGKIFKRKLREPYWAGKEKRI